MGCRVVEWVEEPGGGGRVRRGWGGGACGGRTS